MGLSPSIDDHGTSGTICCSCPVMSSIRSESRQEAVFRLMRYQMTWGGTCSPSFSLLARTRPPPLLEPFASLSCLAPTATCCASLLFLLLFSLFRFLFLFLLLFLFLPCLRLLWLVDFLSFCDYFDNCLYVFICSPTGELVLSGTLEHAQERKADALITRARLSKHHRLLDIGFGWGGISIR